MPKVFLEGTVKLISNESFQGEDGQAVNFNKVYIQCETDEGDKVLVLNTKEDLSKIMDREAIFTLGLRSSRDAASAFKLTILEAKPINGKSEPIIKA